jgi:hypothetical protein
MLIFSTYGLSTVALLMVFRTKASIWTLKARFQCGKLKALRQHLISLILGRKKSFQIGRASSTSRSLISITQFIQ